MFKTYHDQALTDCSKTLFKKLPALARKTGLIERKSSRFSASGFVLTLLKSTLTAKASFNQLATTLGKNQSRTLSRQALWSRIDKYAVGFMLQVLGTATCHTFQPQLKKLSHPFKRILIEDSTQQALPKKNHPDFPAHGNGKSPTAGAKIDLCFDLISGNPITTSLQLATTNDREIGKDLLAHIRSQDLIMRDMGYFILSDFAQIESQNAFWLSRLPANVTAHTQDGTPLETYLKKAKSNQLELTIYLGKERKKARLVAMRVDPETATARCREHRQKAKQQKRPPKKQTLQRADWHLLVTNITPDQMENKQLAELYALRWKIEITFRAWKQSGRQNIALNRKSNPHHLECLLLASMLWLVLTLRVESIMRKQINRLSIEKLAHHLSEHVITIHQLKEIFTYAPDPRHIQMDRRKRKNLEDIMLTALS